MKNIITISGKEKRVTNSNTVKSLILPLFFTSQSMKSQAWAGDEKNLTKRHLFSNPMLIFLFILTLSITPLVQADLNETNETIINITSYKIIIYPDIQTYTGEANFSVLNDTTTWVINQSPDYVLFVGDMVSTNPWPHWNNSIYITNRLTENNITYLISKGNHDELIDVYYPNRSLFLLDENKSLGIVCLNYFTEDYINEIRNVLLNNTNLSFIVLTHVFHNYDGGTTESERIVNGLINDTNIFMFISGHFEGNGIKIGNLTNYSYYALLNGHNGQDGISPFGETEGVIRILDFYSNGTIHSSQYSPIKDKEYIVADLNNFTINYSLVLPNIYFPVPSQPSSGGGGGGGSSYIQKNTTNSSLCNVSVINMSSTNYTGVWINSSQNNLTLPLKQTNNTITQNITNHSSQQFEVSSFFVGYPNMFQRIWRWVISLFRR